MVNMGLAQVCLLAFSMGLDQVSLPVLGNKDLAQENFLALVNMNLVQEGLLALVRMDLA